VLGQASRIDGGVDDLELELDPGQPARFSTPQPTNRMALTPFISVLVSLLKISFLLPPSLTAGGSVGSST
jgi:hypothetical protein